MSGGELTAILVVLIPAVGTALGWAMKASREAGRADEYKRTTEVTIAEKNKQLDEQKVVIAGLTEKLEVCREAGRFDA